MCGGIVLDEESAQGMPDQQIGARNRQPSEERLERVACTFGGWRSIQLSYGCILLLTQCLRGFLTSVKW